MRIKIWHYEPGQDTPYEREDYYEITDFSFDTDGKAIFFRMADHQPYNAEYRHRIKIQIDDVPAAALGSIKSERKAVSSRENGRKGGRPPKHPRTNYTGGDNT